MNDYYIGQQFRGDLYDLATATWLKTTNNHNQHTAKKSRGKEVLVTVDKVCIHKVTDHRIRDRTDHRIRDRTDCRISGIFNILYH